MEERLCKWLIVIILAMFVWAVMKPVLVDMRSLRALGTALNQQNQRLQGLEGRLSIIETRLIPAASQ